MNRESSPVKYEKSLVPGGMRFARHECRPEVANASPAPSVFLADRGVRRVTSCRGEQ